MEAQSKEIKVRDTSLNGFGVFADGEFIGTAPTFEELKKLAVQTVKTNPTVYCTISRIGFNGPEMYEGTCILSVHNHCNMILIVAEIE